MRHLKAGKRLGVTTSHRKAMMRNLVTSLLEHGEIKTTITRAKEMRKYFDKMIGLGKKNSLHSRRQALSFIKTKEAYRKLFEEYGPLYADRSGGYTRIFRLGTRLGDNAQMALIQMVGLNEEEAVKEKPVQEKIEEIKEELQEETEQKAEATEEIVEATEAAESEEAEAKEVEATAEAEESKEAEEVESATEEPAEEKPEEPAEKKEEK